MKTENKFASRKTYIEENLKGALTAFPDFESIEYDNEIVSNKEYVRLTTILGEAIYFDVTALDLTKVFEDVAVYIITENVDEIPSFIKDKNARRHAALFFKR